MIKEFLIIVELVVLRFDQSCINTVSANNCSGGAMRCIYSNSQFD